MGKRERIEKKTGKKQYKSRYYWVDENKVRHDADTGWFYSKEEANKEAKRLEKANKDRISIPLTKNRDKKLSDAYKEYLVFLDDESKKDGKYTYIAYYRHAEVMFRTHTSASIKNTKVKDIDGTFFRNWLSSLNRIPTIGGQRIRAFKSNLLRFNRWLAENYYYYGESEKEYQIEVAIGRVNLQKKSEHNKELLGLRNVYSSIEFEKITEYFMPKIYEFRNFYFYTLFHVLFFGGLREEELIALQWKNVDIENKHIHIVNAITDLEPKASIDKRLKSGGEKTKNNQSKRIISVFDFYSDLLLDYKECYMYEYNLDENTIKEAFVFPNLYHKDPYVWTNGKNLRYQLKKVEKATGLPHSDIQCFRHACAYFLILPSPDGLGFTEDRVKDHFGHEDTKMLRTIYGKLDMLQKSERMDENFKELRTVDTTPSEEQIKKENFIDRVKGNNDKAIIYREKRIYAQIDNAIKIGRTDWGYMPKDKEIINKYISDNESCNINFYEREI